MLLSLLLPLFLLTAGGFALSRLPILKERWQPALNELTARVFIPALLFSGASRNGIPDDISWRFMTAFFVPLIVLFAIVAWCARRTPDGAARALAATYSNTVFVGIPVLTQLFGADSLMYAFPVIAFHGLVAFTLYYLAASARSGKPLAAALITTVKNPIVASLMLGLAVNAAGWKLDDALGRTLGMLSDAALPSALLALGASLSAFRLGSRAVTAAIVLVKLVLLPAGVLTLATLLDVAPHTSAVLILLAACPVGVNAAAVVQADDANPAVVSSAILLSSVLCVGTLPAWVYFARLF